MGKCLYTNWVNSPSRHMQNSNSVAMVTQNITGLCDRGKNLKCQGKRSKLGSTLW